MRKKIIIDMFSFYKHIYESSEGINQTINNSLKLINSFIPEHLEDEEEVYFIFESRQYEKELYENKKELKISKKHYETYEMAKNYIIEILKVDNKSYRIIKVPRQDYDAVFSTLCKYFNKFYIEIFSKNMLLCKNLNMNVIYRNDSDFITYQSFLESYGFIPNKYSITFYFFLKSYIESEVMNIIMKGYNSINSFNSFSNYIKSFDNNIQNKIYKSIKKIKEIFDFYNYSKEYSLNIEDMSHYCENNKIKKELLMSSIGLNFKKSNDAEKFFDI